MESAKAVGVSNGWSWISKSSFQVISSARLIGMILDAQRHLSQQLLGEYSIWIPLPLQRLQLLDSLLAKPTLERAVSRKVLKMVDFFWAAVFGRFRQFLLCCLLDSCSRAGICVPG